MDDDDEEEEVEEEEGGGGGEKGGASPRQGSGRRFRSNQGRSELWRVECSESEKKDSIRKIRNRYKIRKYVTITR